MKDVYSCMDTLTKKEGEASNGMATSPSFRIEHGNTHSSTRHCPKQAGPKVKQQQQKQQNQTKQKTETIPLEPTG